MADPILRRRVDGRQVDEDLDDGGLEFGEDMVCAGCGCTDDAPCVEGCRWADVDLCSRCGGSL